MSTKKMTRIAALLALSLVAIFLEVPYPPIPFLKFDFSDLIILMAVVVVGIYPAILIAVVKNMAFYLKGTAIMIGPIAALVASLSMVITFYICAKKFKFSSIKSVIMTTIVTSLIMTLMNYLFITPAYMGSFFFTDIIESFKFEYLGIPEFRIIPFLSDYANAIIIVYLPFNLFKYSIISFIFVLLEKRIRMFSESNE